MAVIARYDFDDTGSVAADSATADGAQDGIYRDGAAASGGRAFVDGIDDRIKFESDLFQLSRGTLEIQFAPAGLTAGPQTVLSRDSLGETAGGFRIEVMPDGSVRITHEDAGSSTTYQTDPGFLSPGDEVRVSYSWDEAAGGRVLIDNLSQGTGFEADTPAGLTMDMGAINQKFMIGAGQSQSDPGILNNIGDFYRGEVEYFQISDTVDNTGPDGIVSGTAGSDLIDLSYTGDPDGDRIDAGDAILPGAAPDDDVVVAGAGDDTVRAGEGNDLVYGGAGHDLLEGGRGDDTLHGGAGNDTLDGGEGANLLDGGDDRDVIFARAGDRVAGGAGGDDFDVLRLGRAIPPGGSYELRDVVTDADGNSQSGTAIIRDADGNEVGRVTFCEIEEIVPCFTPGTMIATPRGEVPVETLVPGDRVVTRDNGIQEIAWIGARHLEWPALNANPHLRPVLVRQGSLGNGLPERDLMVSPNHRLLVANDRTALYFDEHEVLVAAKHLAAGRAIQQVQAAGVTYIHFMFPRHEVVLANGAWTESFQPGDNSLKGIGNAQRTEIFELFPELRAAKGLESYAAARRTLRRHEARVLAAG